MFELFWVYLTSCGFSLLVMLIIVNITIYRYWIEKGIPVKKMPKRVASLSLKKHALTICFIPILNIIGVIFVISQFDEYYKLVKEKADNNFWIQEYIRLVTYSEELK